MEKEFVPYELALRMKQLGFNETCLGYYAGYILCTGQPREIHLDEDGNYKMSKTESFPITVTPTYSQAFRWFREKYKLYTEIHKKFDGIGVSIILSEYRYDHRQDKEVEYHIPKYFGNIHKSYEEAETACLEELIEIVESKSE
jgi:hypothetical protein